ncbi:MAG: DUF1365 domain-containing protein [Steroidobacteraceae bacterium]|jgi:DUF1365 family protein|nr:DUF1365 domain-containing protein [Steroidobacteraceae bacterium]
MQSALYRGWVRHRRVAPTRNSFRYRLFMVWLDLAELDRVFAGRWFWSTTRRTLARFVREDYLAPHDRPLDVAVRDLVEAKLGVRPAGAVRMLTHLRYFGYCFNPVTFYYCYDADDRLETIVAEITNTPWGERHPYVLPVAGARRDANAHAWEFGKRFHVSPFLPMDMDYEWRFDAPAERLNVHMVNRRAGETVFDATLALAREPITGASLARALAGYPFMTARVWLMIHWQALKLLLKRTPFHVHPAKAGAARPDPGAPA